MASKPPVTSGNSPRKNGGGGGGKPPPLTPSQLSAGGKQRRLRSLGNVRGFVASVLRRVEAGDLDPDVGRVLLYGSNILAGLIEGEGLEARVAALEKLLGKQAPNQPAPVTEPTSGGS